MLYKKCLAYHIESAACNNFFDWGLENIFNFDLLSLLLQFQKSLKLKKLVILREAKQGMVDFAPISFFWALSKPKRNSIFSKKDSSDFELTFEQSQ